MTKITIWTGLALLVAVISFTLRYGDTSGAWRISGHDWTRAQTASLGATLDSPPHADLIEVIDYECGVCRASYSELERLAAENPQIRVRYLLLPNPRISRLSEPAAKMAVCAAEQERLKEMHETLLGSAAWRSAARWRDVAEEAGVADLSRFDECLSAPRTSKVLASHREAAAALGVSATPSFVLNGYALRGARSSEHLKEAVLATSSSSFRRDDE